MFHIKTLRHSKRSEESKNIIEILRLRLRMTKQILSVLIILFLLGLNCIPTINAQQDDNELFLVAEKAFEDGFYDVAMRYIEQLLQKNPQTQRRVQANLLLGQCYFFKSEYLKAYDVFQSLLSYSEYKDATLYWLGETYLKGSDYKQAAKQYRELIDRFPDSSYVPQAYYSLGWSYFEENNFKEAKEAFIGLVKKYAKHQLAEDAYFKLGEIEHNLHNYENAVGFFKDFIINYPQSHRHAEAYFYIGESYYYLTDTLNAISYYAKAAEIAYDNKLTLMAKVSLGWCYLKLEKFQLAQQYFDEALKLSQEKGILSDDVYLGMANLYTETKDYQKARDAYNQLIERFPNSHRLAEAYLGKANTHYLLEDYENAIKTYRTIINKFSANNNYQETLEKAYFGLAWSYLKIGNIDLSVETFKTIKDQSENKTVKISALTQIADAYQDVGQLEKAIDIYDQILRDYSDSPYTDYAQYRQGIALLKMDKTEMATLSFQSLKTNFPNSKYLTDAKYYLAVAYFKKGDWVSTKEQVQEFMKNLPNTNEFLPEAQYILGLSYFNLNEFEKALNTFQSIIKNYPEQTALVKNSEINIAKCFYKLGNIKEGLAKFKFIISKYPKSDIAQEALIYVGDHYLESSDYDNAIVSYQQFINNFPGSSKLNLVRYELGQAYLGKDEYDQAINILKLIDDPKQAELYAKAKLAIADIFSKKLDPESTIETYQNIITTSPEFKRDAFVKIAQVNKLNKAYDKAMEAYQSALKSEKGSSQTENFEIQFQMGDTYELAHQTKEAIDTYLKIPYLYPQELSLIIKAYLRIARLFEDNEQWEEAKTTYQKILTYNTEESKFAQERLEWINNTIKLLKN